MSNHRYILYTEATGHAVHTIVVPSLMVFKGIVRETIQFHRVGINAFEALTVYSDHCVARSVQAHMRALGLVAEDYTLARVLK